MTLKDGASPNPFDPPDCPAAAVLGVERRTHAQCVERDASRREHDEARSFGHDGSSSGFRGWQR